jgi:GNAT superfamily N-acetyltransferase
VLNLFIADIEELSDGGGFARKLRPLTLIYIRYLAPFIVLEKFRGRGIGRLLLQYAIDQADAESPPTPIYLEALPNARPVYLHLGFQPRDGKGREEVLIRRGVVKRA